ncbi:MAG: hypothetical protein GTO05_13740 [Gemmatimonadales bacterium]|nr:hypothetical protein [Gemmatimonadales bacterium]
MYQVRDDRVVEIESAPPPDTGAPLPAVVSDEWHVLLAYIVSEPDPDWDGSYVEVVSPGTPNELVAVVRFERPCCHLFGPPNDEALHGHPLASRGLRHYSVSEVINSSWVHSLERMNSVHPQHRPERFGSYRHYIFAFHDSTFECVAEGFEVKLHRGSLKSAVRLMSQMLDGDMEEGPSA